MQFKVPFEITGEIIVEANTEDEARRKFRQWTKPQLAEEGNLLELDPLPMPMEEPVAG